MMQNEPTPKIDGHFRNQVIEECAQVAEIYPGKIGGKFGRAIANAIRKLKELE
jgi:hypothetical protein